MQKQQSRNLILTHWLQINSEMQKQWAIFAEPALPRISPLQFSIFISYLKQMNIQISHCPKTSPEGSILITRGCQSSEGDDSFTVGSFDVSLEVKQKSLSAFSANALSSEALAILVIDNIIITAKYNTEEEH